MTDLAGLLQQLDGGVEVPRLYVGDIVENPVRGSRGVVIHADGKGEGASAGVVLLEGYRYAIRTSPGHTIVTMNRQAYDAVGHQDGYWIRVPEERWTIPERVHHLLHTWEPPPWIESGQDIDRCDSFEFHLLLALFPDRALADDIMEGDTPSLDDLGLYLAANIERAIAARATAGVLPSRSGAS